MKSYKTASLADYTSFGTGGESTNLLIIEDLDELLDAIKTQPAPFWVLGTGSNVLISDEGLPGTTLILQMKGITFEDDQVIAAAGEIWDSLVEKTIERGLWGIEHMSGIPSSVGGAVVGNIAAYGQAVFDTLLWVDVLDISSDNLAITRMSVDELGMNYRSSIFSRNSYNNIIILQAAFQLSNESVVELRYEKALEQAIAHGLDPAKLKQRREIILHSRDQAGSLLDKTSPQKSAGSFFKNPLVSSEQADQLMQFEEFSVSKPAIRRQNKIHGGDETRVSAAHVVLAAGFKRGQEWGPVRIHPDHALKIENTGDATSQQIYNVAHEIMKTAKDKLDITLVPEVRFLGKYN